MESPITSVVGGGVSAPCIDEETAGASVVTVELVEGACCHVIGGDPCTKWITNDK